MIAVLRSRGELAKLPPNATSMPAGGVLRAVPHHGAVSLIVGTPNGKIQFKICLTE
jgi:hypothetical protein